MLICACSTGWGLYKTDGLTSGITYLVYDPFMSGSTTSPLISVSQVQQKPTKLPARDLLNLANLTQKQEAGYPLGN